MSNLTPQQEERAAALDRALEIVVERVGDRGVEVSEVMSLADWILGIQVSREINDYPISSALTTPL